MKQKKVMKRILIIAVAAAVSAAGIGGGLYLRGTSMTAEVTSVEALDNGYWGDEIQSSGIVTNDYSQTVELGTEDEIKEVYVEEGQQVQKGDKLLALDTTAASLNYESKVLTVENLNNQISIAQNELKTLKNTKPYVEPVQPEPELEPDPQEPGDAEPEMDGDAYNYITWTAVPYNQSEADGTEESPYRYLCAPTAYVTGSFLGQVADSGLYVVFEIRENNSKDGELISSWEVDGSQTVVPDEATIWSVASRMQIIEEELSEEETSEGEADVPETPADASVTEEPQYTQEELNTMIAEKEKELKDLDLSKRKAELDVQKLKNQSSDGIIYATVTGTVKNLQDKDNLPKDGTPFLEVTGSEGLYVTGGISELLLDQVQPGQVISVMAWESGVSCEAEITEIKDYPSDSVSSYGNGNQNVSYYPFTAYIEDTSGLKNGEYVDLTMTVDGDTQTDSFYIYKAYIRTENGRSYVMKADENDRLVKQYVETGKIVYGDTIEIKSGLAADDRIAFPYGNTAKEGVRAVNAEDSY